MPLFSRKLRNNESKAEALISHHEADDKYLVLYLLDKSNQPPITIFLNALRTEYADHDRKNLFFVHYDEKKNSLVVTLNGFSASKILDQLAAYDFIEIVDKKIASSPRCKK